MKLVNIWILRRLFAFAGLLLATARSFEAACGRLDEIVERLRVSKGVDMEQIAPLS
jgi:hypothetical protein